MSGNLKIYCDTCTLAPNIEKCSAQLEALKRLRELCEAGKCSMYRSHIALAELEETKDAEKRERLRADYELVENILHDERLLGIGAAFNDLGTYANYPIISDVQDPKLFEEIYQVIKRCNKPTAKAKNLKRDAEHLAQAIFDGCDVFLTRDRKTIIRPIGPWLEYHHHLKARTPTKIIAEIEQQSD